MLDVTNQTNIKYRQSFYILAVICTIVPELKMSNREKGRKKTKQETSTQYKVTDSISMADLENIHTRKGNTPVGLHPKALKIGKRSGEKRRKEYLRQRGKGP